MLRMRIKGDSELILKVSVLKFVFTVLHTGYIGCRGCLPGTRAIFVSYRPFVSLSLVRVTNHPFTRILVCHAAQMIGRCQSES